MSSRKRKRITDVVTEEDLPQIQIKTASGLKRFLEAIHEGFLAVVDPREGHLLDVMEENSLVFQSDKESLSGKDVYVRRDKARKLWFYLYKMRVEDFTSVVLPHLRKEFPHILPATFNEDSTEENDVCFRHDVISKVRTSTMADLLFGTKCLSFEEYENISSMGDNKPTVWSLLFTAIQRSCTLDTAEKLRQLLVRRRVDTPVDFLGIMSRGTQCTCTRAQQMPPPTAPHVKVTQWIERSVTTVACSPATDLESETTVECSSTTDQESMCDGMTVSSISQAATAARPVQTGPAATAIPIPTRYTPRPGEEWKLALVGREGSGKSSSGNTILGRQAFGTHSNRKKGGVTVTASTVRGGRNINVKRFQQLLSLVERLLEKNGGRRFVSKALF